MPDRDREKQSRKRALDYGTGKKELSNVVKEEAIESAFDWLERGGVRRIWFVLKITIFFAVSISLLILISFLD